MLLYRLTFEAGAEIVTLRTIKNFKNGADIASVINANFPYFNTDDSSVLMIYDKNDKPIHHHHHNNKDVIGDGCTYFVRRQSVKRSSRSSKKYWRR